ncbi:hypothetical protein [Pseudomonas baetica]|uniref:hypothetical protein n=1 Tax=Pseudomonas baetica TaxID=674054 RepID=UPI001FCA431A|nr:hypothetical protein [Pseudomonas baetica]
MVAGLAQGHRTDATLAVFGVKDRDGQGALSVWYHSGRVVVAASSLQGKPLQFVGFEDDGSRHGCSNPAAANFISSPPWLRMRWPRHSATMQCWMQRRKFLS